MVDLTPYRDWLITRLQKAMSIRHFTRQAMKFMAELRATTFDTVEGVLAFSHLTIEVCEWLDIKDERYQFHGFAMAWCEWKQDCDNRTTEQAFAYQVNDMWNGNISHYNRFFALCEINGAWVERDRVFRALERFYEKEL